MKKRFTSFLAALALLVFMMPTMAGWGQTRAEEVYKTALFGSSNNSQGTSNYTTDWYSTTDGFIVDLTKFNNNGNGWNGLIKTGNKTTATVGTIVTRTAIDQAITKVDLTISAITTSKVNSIKLYTSSDNSSWTEVGTYDKSTGVKSVSITTPTANLYYKIAFDCTNGGSSNGFVTISKVEYYHSTGGTTVATPTFDPAGGTYTEEQLVEIECETENAVIYYTTDGTTPDNTSTEYDPDEGVTISETTTLKAIAYVGNDASSVASATYTIVTPLTTISQIFAKATEVGSTQTDVYVTFGNWIVVGKSYSNAYVSDGQYGLNLYKSGGINFEIGDQLSGTVATKVQLYTGGAELVGLSKPFEGLTVTSNQTFEPYPISLADLVGQGIYFGSYVDLGNLTYTSGGKFTDGNNHEINPYNTFSIQNYPTLEAGKTYRVKGVFIRYNTTERIAPVYASDFTEYAGPSIEATPSSLTVPSYVVGTTAPTYNVLTVNGSNLTANISLTLNANSDFEMSTDNSTWSSSLTLTQANGSVTNAQVSIRLKAGLAKGNYTGTVTLSSTDAQDVVVNLSGSVTGQTYNIVLTQPATGGTIASDLEAAEEGTTVTLTATPAAAYNFGSWIVKDANEGPITVTDNQFEMPASNVSVTATFSLKPTYAITCAITPEGAALMEATPASAYEGQTVTLTYTAETGYSLSGIVITKTSNGSATGITPTASGDDFTFTMPGYAVTATATFLSENFDGSFILFEDELVEGDYLIVYNNKAMNNVVTSSKFGHEAVSPSQNGIITNPSRNIVWHIAPSVTEGYWTIYNAKMNQYVNATAGNTNLNLVDELIYASGAKWAVTEDESTYDFRCKANEDLSSGSTVRYIRYYNDVYGHYAGSNGGALTLYKRLLDVAPTWTSFPTTAGIITGANYELNVSDYVSGTPNPTITVTTLATGYTLSNGTFTFTTSTANTYTFTFTATNAAGSANVTLTITVSEPAKVTCQYSINGELIDEAASITQGEFITLAEAADDLNEDFTFAGWTDNLGDIENNIHTPGTSYQVNDNVVFYAVYAHEVEGIPVTSYNKVSSISTGDYLIVCENSNVAFDGSLETLDAVGNAINVSIENNTIASSESTDEAVFTISTIQDGYSIQSASGYYIGQTSDANGLSSSDETVYTNSISITDDGDAVVSSGGAYLRYNSASNQTRFRYYKSSSYTGQQAIQLYKKETTTPSTTEYYTRIQSITGTTEITTVTPADLITVPNNAVLTIRGTTCTGTAENLIIEEGGQLIVPTGTEVAATFIKSVPENTSKKVAVTGWTLISSPTNNGVDAGNPYENFGDVTNLEDGDGYLLYNYDEENRIWRSSQTTDHTYSTLNVGQGYLYGNSTGTAIEFTGNVNSAASYLVDLSYNAKDSDNLAGFNLIGNPFSHDIYKGVGGAINDSKLADGFYIIENGEAWTAKLGYDTPIKPGQGILVKATEEFKLTINNTTANATADKANHDNIMFKVENSECSDVAFALFDKGYGLNKISHRGDMVPMLYIPQNGENYAIAMMDDNTNSFNLGFEAKTTAKYTLTYKAKGEFNYLHVIDRMTGEDIDMLLEGEYSFVGSPQDDNNRFIVRLGYLPNYDDNGEDTFAYQNGSDIVVSGEGELQIFDVMGRKVASITINGVETVNIPTQGVYIMKLNEKTQKIVVR